jgi:signal peptidase II
VKPLTFYAGLVAVAVALDQWIKYLVETRLVLHQQVDLLPFLALYRTYNTGIAFSMLSSFGDTGLIVVSFAVFNLADAFISVGAATVLLEEFFGWRRQRAD